MKYYEIAIFSTPNIFTYSSDSSSKKGDVVEVEVKSKIKKGMILREVEMPSFKCKPVIKKVGEFTENQLELIEFISKYYFSSIGESAGNFYEKWE